MTDHWRLDDTRQTLVLAADEGRLPSVVYWGACLPPDEDLGALTAVQEIDITGGMLDDTPDLSICPEAGRSFPGQPGLALRDGSSRPLLTVFQLESVHREGLTLHITAGDAGHGLTYHATIALDPETHVLAMRASLRSDAPVHLQWLSTPVLPAPQQSDGLIDYSGRWCGEFTVNRTPWAAGVRMRESRVGRTDHAHFPGLILPLQGATNTQGEAFGLHYGWSGGHRMIAEELPDGRRQVQFGNAADTEMAAGTFFETATLYATYSDSGFNGIGTAFQRHLRDRIVTWPWPDRPRPVHYNCWEAVYFDHKLDELKEIASRAAGLGAERFVLDDGWFAGRDSDTSALGDWWVSPVKYPDGLDPLIRHVHKLGMTFGLWFEPEMVNEHSELFFAHPDWILGEKDQILGRQQYVLDMSRTEVRDYLFGCISELLEEHDIDYIKWDHNRVLPAPDAAQARGTYDLLARLRAAFPQVEIESCASGGGRIDFGILHHTQRVWLSDSNDALERLRMQHEAALFLPAAVTGSHVGPRRCHTSGRELDMELRAWVAAQRHMGFEMDPRELDGTERAVLREVTDWWKDNRDWLMRADILRLDSADPAVTAEQQLAADGARFVVFAGRMAASRQIAPRPLRLAGLDPHARYRIHLRNRAAAPALSRGEQRLKREDVTLTGTALMRQGLTLPWHFPQTIWVIEGKKL